MIHRITQICHSRVGGVDEEAANVLYFPNSETTPEDRRVAAALIAVP